MLFGLAYVSRATQPFDDAALVALADHAAEKNRRLLVTGYLNYKQGEFFQYLEGVRPQVLELMQTIAADPRHEVLNVVHLGETPSRRFDDWSMRYVTPYEMDQITHEDVLLGVLRTMRGPMFEEQSARETTLRLVLKIAENRGRLSHLRR